MARRVIITDNADKVAYNMAKRYGRMKSKGAESVRFSAEFMKKLMWSIAPKDTGATVRAVKWTKGKTPSSATVIIGDGHPETRGRINNFTKYMNEVPKGSVYYRHFKSNKEPHFIDASVVETKVFFGKAARRVVNAFVNGK